MYVLEISTVSVEWVAPSLLIFLVLFIPATIFSAGVFYHQNKFLTDVEFSQANNAKGEPVEKGQGTEKPTTRDYHPCQQEQKEKSSASEPE